jgi:hypothetical protein
VVFSAIYSGKRRAKTVGEIAAATGCTRKQVLNAGLTLVKSKLVDQVRRDRETAYEKIDFFDRNKRKVLRLATDPKKLESYPTKRNPRITSPMVTVRVDARRAAYRQVTIDDIDSFSAVRSTTASGHLPKTVSEGDFKAGVQAVIGEPGTFRDWGGEKNDLFSTRIRIEGRRRPVAFAFKGPGTTGRLTPKKMGKNGDQIQRLFETDADVFILQYCGEIDQSVFELVGIYALTKAYRTGRRIWYGIIDGHDSNRLYTAYRAQFP